MNTKYFRSLLTNLLLIILLFKNKYYLCKQYDQIVLEWIIDAMKY